MLPAELTGKTKIVRAQAESFQPADEIDERRRKIVLICCDELLQIAQVGDKEHPKAHVQLNMLERNRIDAVMTDLLLHGTPKPSAGITTLFVSLAHLIGEIDPSAPL